MAYTLTGCNQPEFGDYLAYYGADAGQEYLKNEMNARTKRGELGLGELLLGFGGYVVLESVKKSVNQGLCSPLKSLYAGRPEKTMELPANGMLTLKRVGKRTKSRRRYSARYS